MKTSAIARFTALLSLRALSAFAADVAGKWTARVSGRDGAMNETAFDLKVAGEVVRGTATSSRGAKEMMAGKVLETR